MGCSGTRASATDPAGDDKLKKRSAAYLLRQLETEPLEPEWLAGRAKVTVRSEAQGVQKFNLNVRYRRDSIIWMNAKKASVEAGRVLITRDSIYFINRLDNQYGIVSISAAAERLGLPGDFDQLQALLLGRPVFFTRELAAKVIGDRYRLNGETERWETEYFLDGDYRLRRYRVQEPAVSRTLDVRLDAYAPLGEKGRFSHLRTISAYSPESDAAELLLEWSKLELDEPKTIRFSIPPRYERIDW